jgi:hypothetical protein
MSGGECDVDHGTVWYERTGSCTPGKADKVLTRRNLRESGPPF